MFKTIELMFKSSELKFKSTEHKFRSLEHNFLLGLATSLSRDKRLFLFLCQQIHQVILHRYSLFQIQLLADAILRNHDT